MALMGGLCRDRKWLVLPALAMSTSIALMDSTILPVALPTLRQAFDLSSVAVQWIMNSYLLVLACFVFVGGRLADFWGKRFVFCLGMGLFGVASIIGGCAYHQFFLIFSRSLQGLGSALMLPASMAILPEVVPQEQQGRAIGSIVSISSLFLCLGPLIGGGFAEYLSWRWIFFINIPIVIGGIWIIIKTLSCSEKKQEEFHWLGFFMFIGMLNTLILALMQAREWGWGSIGVVLLFTLSGFFACMLVWLLPRARVPFIDYHLFKNASFMGANLIVVCVQFVLMVGIYWVIYFQSTLHYTPFQAGALLLISTLPVVFGAPLSGYLTDRFGARTPILVGFSIICLSFLLWMSPSADKLFLLIPTLFLFGAGSALVMTPVGKTMLNAVPRTRTGAGMGIYSTLRHTAAPLGVAVLGSLMNNISFFSFAKYGEQEEVLRGLDFMYYGELIAGGVSLLPHLDGLSLYQIAFL